MKRLVLLIGLLAGMSVQAQNLKELFVEMPDTLLPMLTKVNRADFGDFLESGMKAEVRNRFGNTSEMTQLTDDFLRLKVSSVSTVEMKLLPLNDSLQVICAVHTCQAPVADSHVKFYDTSWNVLPSSQFLELPSDSLFFKPAVSVEQADSLRMLRANADMCLMEAKLSADEQTLRFYYTTPEYLDKEVAETLKPYLREKPLLYRWDSRRFVGSR